jgi:hypothetical protein
MVLAENVSVIKDHEADFLKLENDLGILGEEAIGNFKKRSKTFMNCPQKVRHYLGVFLLKEKSNTIMNLNFAV